MASDKSLQDEGDQSWQAEEIWREESKTMQGGQKYLQTYKNARGEKDKLKESFEMKNGKQNKKL